MIEANLEMLKSLSPTKEEVTKMEATLREKRRVSGKSDDEDTAEIKELIGCCCRRHGPACHARSEGCCAIKEDVARVCA